jgi:hypothetical protein
MFYSQAGQDVWVLQKIGNKGFFVDIGAHDGVESSNTYALEKAGWSGICVEPNEAAVNKYTVRRRWEVMYAGRGKVIPGMPAIVDYLSIDVDGEDEQVLKEFPFDKVYVRLITIEHNQYLEGFERQQRIYEYLSKQGFLRTNKDVKCLDPNYFGLIYEDWYENINDKPRG